MNNNNLFTVYFNKEENKVRIIEQSVAQPKNENIIGQTDGIDNANDIVSIIKAVNPSIIVEMIKEEV